MAKAPMYLSQLEGKKTLMLDDIKKILSENGDVNVLDENVECNTFVSIHGWDAVMDNEVLVDVFELRLLTDGRIWFVDEYGNEGDLSDKTICDVYNVLEWLENEISSPKKKNCEYPLDVANTEWLDDVTFLVTFASVQAEDNNGCDIVKEVQAEYHHDEGKIEIVMCYYEIDDGDYLGNEEIGAELSLEQIKKVREIVIKEVAKRFSK